ncbi:MAG TPA: MFS transporter [Gammaproteobacteria bacterium]
MYWRLSTFYLFYFASLGALVPYWSLYLKHLGFTALEIGQLMALLMTTKIISPNIWGWIADHTGRPMAVVRLGSLLALVAFSLVFFVHDYWPLALVMVGYSFFWHAALPQFESTTLGHLGKEHHRYSQIRLWGSIGFIVSVASLGPLMDIAGPGWLPPVLLTLFGAIWLSSLGVPESRRHQEEEPGAGSLFELLSKPEVIALLAVCFLAQASHGPYYTFYTLYLEAHGYSHSTIGQMWALGVIAEIGIFMVMHRLAPQFGLRALLIIALLLTTVRWLMIGYWPDSLTLLLSAQTLHAASFGIFHAVAIALFHRHFRGRHHGRGQALYSSLAFGGGGAFGALYSGMGWESLGPAITFAIAALLAFFAAVIAWRWIEVGR